MIGYQFMNIPSTTNHKTMPLKYGNIKDRFVPGSVHRKINPFGKGWKGGRGDIGGAECGDTAFRAPGWSSKPEYSADLNSITTDSISKVIKLDKHSCYLVGKNPEMCNVLLDHPSISRQHASFIHSKLGVTYLVDLNSSHGTFNAKNKIGPKRLFELRSGNIIKFGKSSKTYIFRAFLNEEQALNKFSEEKFVETETDENDPCNRELCLNTSLNARISYLNRGETFNISKAEEIVEPVQKKMRPDAEKIGVSKLKRTVTFSEEPPYIIPEKKNEKEDQSKLDHVKKIDSNAPVVGKFASLVSSETIVTTRKSVNAPGVSKPPSSSSSKSVSDAERRRRQALLMDHTRSLMKPPVRQQLLPVPTPAIAKSEPRPPPPPREENDEEEDDEGPMDLRKC